MTDEPLFDIELAWPGERPNYPRAKPWERLTGGIPFDDCIGICPGDTDEEFAETLRECRSMDRGWEPPTC